MNTPKISQNTTTLYTEKYKNQQPLNERSPTGIQYKTLTHPKTHHKIFTCKIRHRYNGFATII